MASSYLPCASSMTAMLYWTSSESGTTELAFFKRLHRLIELAVAAIDLGDAHVGLRIRRISVDDGFVLLQRGFGLTVVHQVLGQPANRVQIVMIQFGRLAVGLDRLLVFLFLLVGVAQRRVQLGGARLFRNRVQDFQRAVRNRLLRCRGRPAW